MILETQILTFPHADTPKTTFVSPYVNALKESMKADGLLIHEMTRYHGLKRVTARIFRDAEALAMWETNPLVEARLWLYRDFYDRNGVTYVTTIDHL